MLQTRPTPADGNGQEAIPAPLATGTLTEKAAFLDLLLDATNDGIMDWNLVTGATFYNPRWKALLGFEGDELIETPSSWRELTHPDDLPKVEAGLRDHLEQEWPFVCTARMRHRHGGWRWILSRGCALRSAAGKPVRIVITYTDISDRIRAEEHQRALVAAIPDTMFRVGPDGVVTDLKMGNDQGGALFKDLAVGTLLRFAVDSAACEPLILAIQDALDSGTPATVNLCTHHGALTEYHEVRVVLSGDGESLCIVRNVTQQRSLETRLIQSQKLEAVGHLAAGIAHEINTPLQFAGDNLHFAKTVLPDLFGLIAYYQTLLQPQASDNPEVAAQIQDREVISDLPYLLENLPSVLDRALEGMQRVSAIVRAMKSFSHPGSQEKLYAEINSIIENTVIVATNEWRPIADLVMQLDPELPTIPCLAGELGQVVLNLLVNAAHAIAEVSDPDGPKGRITIATGHDDGWVDIRITDTGGGIPEEIRSKIFDPFFTTKAVGKGTGQGLSLAHATVVERHGGTIHFETVINQGTTFVVRLPKKLPGETANDIHSALR